MLITGTSWIITVAVVVGLLVLATLLGPASQANSGRSESYRL
jgi:hypothetical protein